MNMLMNTVDVRGLYEKRKTRSALLKFSVYWYAFLFLMAIFSTVNVEFSKFVPGLFYAAAAYFLIFVGFCQSRFSYSIEVKERHVYSNLFRQYLRFIVVISLSLSFYCVYFYTGNGIDAVIQSLLAGDSLYNNYQTYFADESLANFSLSKVPAIAAGALLKFNLLFTYIKNFISVDSEVKRNRLEITLVTLAYLYFAIGRGTSFELFEILAIWSFCLILGKSQLSSNKKSKKAWLIILAAILFLILYSYNVSARYGFEQKAECAADGFCLDQNSLIMKISPSAGELIFRLSAYFLFGMLHLSRLIEVIFSSFENVIAVVVPGAASLIFDDQRLVICQFAIDCGAMWIPDLSRLLVSFGILGSAVFLFISGKMGGFALKIVLERRLISATFLLYFFFLYLLSLPVGNFITASSANLINFSISLTILYLKRTKYYR